MSSALSDTLMAKKDFNEPHCDGLRPHVNQRHKFTIIYGRLVVETIMAMASNLEAIAWKKWGAIVWNCVLSLKITLATPVP